MFKSRSRKNTSRRRSLGFENLELRRVLAAYISEFHFDPLFGDSSEDQYLEIRGEPGATIDEGTYFVGIESADRIDTLGDVHAVIDMSNLVFGSNGYMVFVQQGSNWDVATEATVHSGTSGGFGGLTNGVFETNTLDGSIRAGSSTYLLIQSETKPELGDDIDSNNDGTPDGLYLDWTVFDGFATLPWVESILDQRTYAPIAFVEDGVGDGHLPGATVINTTDQAYAGRFGASIGYDNSDWVNGNTVEEPAGTFDFQFQHGTFGTPTHPAFGGEFLDNVGSPNWFSSTSGFVFEDLNEDGIRQANEPGISGLQVTTRYEDTQNVDTSFVESINPDDFEDGVEVSNSPEHFTLITAGTDNVPLGFKVTAEEREPFSIFDKVFAHEGVNFFNDIRRLRMDFYRDVRSVSINVMGNSDSTVTYGRLEAFDKDNNSLGFIRSSGLLDGISEVLTVTSNVDNIAWAVAYSDNEFQGSSAFGEFDTIQVEIPRATITSTADGAYASTPLIADAYEVEIATPGRLYQTTPGNEQGYSVGLAERQDLRGLDFGFRAKGAPAITDQSLNVGEHLAAGEVFAQLAIALDYPSQQLDITITDGDPDNQFTVDQETFELSSTRGDFNFEVRNSYVLDVLIEDRDFPDLSDAGQVTITILDENDTPEVASNNGNLDENSPLGTVVATMQATDEDAPGDASTLTFSIEDGNTGDAFEINAVTGEVRVASPEQINFETNPTFELLVRATDMGAPVEFGEAILSVTLNDLDEIPVVADTGLTIEENSPAFTSVGHLELEEYDAGETITWRIAGVDSMSFDLRSDGELVVKEGVQIDFETKSTYEFFVDATDDGNPPKTGERTITITVIDANDAPVIQTESLQVDENSAAETFVGTVVATDQDGHAVSYSISGGADAGKFTIDPETGELTVAEGAELDFESNAALEVAITASDDQTPSATSEKIVVVNLNDVNDPPSLDVDQSSVVENSAAGTVVAIEINDPDANDSHTFELLSQDADWFAIDAAGQLVVAEGAVINFESSTMTSSVVELRVTDSAGEQATLTITISATDTNDPPTVAMPLEDQTADPNQLFEFVIPDGTFADEDAGDSLRFSATTEAGFSLPSWLTFDAATLTFQGTPTDSDSGSLNVKVNVLDDADALVSDIFTIEVESGFPWHNSDDAEDVNGDNFVTPIDALMVINYLNNAESPEVPQGSGAEFGFVDVNRDNFVTAIDALIVINFLNSGEGEGESYSQPALYPMIGDLFVQDEDDEEDDMIHLLAEDYRSL